MSRTGKSVDVRGGCWQCSPDGNAIWLGKNAMAVASRHADAHGHSTWATQILDVAFGPPEGRP